jgi:phage gpG-like protein
MDSAIRVEGLRDLRRDLKAIDKGLERELRDHLKEAAEAVLPTARALAPKRSGALAASLKATATGQRASIRSRLPYANAQHWGGTVGPKKTSYITGKHFVSRAVEMKQAVVVDKVGDGIDALARKHGFH